MEVEPRHTLLSLFDTVYTIQTVLHCLNSDMHVRLIGLTGLVQCC